MLQQEKNTRSNQAILSTDGTLKELSLEDIETLGKSFDGEVMLSSEKGYQDARQIWNG